MPLRFPGKPGAYRAIYQVTESTHMANAALWAATEARCANQAYNVTNGDYFRWCNLWPRIAEVFEMPWAEPQTISLVVHMADKAPLWDALVARHARVREPPLQRRTPRKREVVSPRAGPTPPSPTSWPSGGRRSRSTSTRSSPRST